MLKLKIHRAKSREESREELKNLDDASLYDWYKRNWHWCITENCDRCLIIETLLNCGGFIEEPYEEELH